MKIDHNLMFVRDIFQYKINNRNIFILSEAHQEFTTKIKGCKDKGYKLIDEYVLEKDDPVVILELSDKFENMPIETYSTNLNILQKMKNISKIYADIRFNIYNEYQYMYDQDDSELECSKVLKMIDIQLDKVKVFHDKVTESCNGYVTPSHQKFIDILIKDAEDNIKLLCDRFTEILKSGKYKVLSDLNKHADAKFMQLTEEYRGSTLSARIHEVIKHSWKKITDICIMIILLSECVKHTNVIILLGEEHVININHIIKQYKKFCMDEDCDM